MFQKIITIFLLVVLFFMSFINIYADELDDISKQLEDFKRSLEMSQQATKPLETDVQKLNKQLEDIKIRVATLEKEIIKKQKEVEKGEEAFAYQKNLLEERTKSYYKNIGKNFSSLIQLLIADNLSISIQNFFYQKYAMEEDKRSIIKIVMYIKNLEEKKANLESENSRLVQLKQEIDKQTNFLNGEITKAKKYQGELQQKITELTVKQQQLLAQKLASLNLPRSASILAGCTDDRDKDPGFSPRFAFYTFGIPHRVGMNQWGAYGRAKAGQDYKTILSSYYNNVRFECRSFPNNNIRVIGYGERNIGDYLKGLGEMPESWGNEGAHEALKAQVVAAASYAYSYTGGGGSEICTTEECQVYLGANKGGKWDQAVDDIKGKCGDGIEVMVSNDTNEVIKAWYSSTFGGYSWTSGEIWGNQKNWTKHASDTKESINSLEELRDSDKAYDKISPYFYCDWGSRSEYGKTAWLKQEEMADIINVLILAKRDTSSQNHLVQVDKPNPDNTDTWDRERVKQELKNLGVVPYNNISNISIDWDREVGKTTSVNILGDAGSSSFNSVEFKNFFNLRAPTNIQIVGPLYNVEKR